MPSFQRKGINGQMFRTEEREMQKRACKRKVSKCFGNWNDLIHLLLHFAIVVNSDIKRHQFVCLHDSVVLAHSRFTKKR